MAFHSAKAVDRPEVLSCGSKTSLSFPLPPGSRVTANNFNIADLVPR
jgi:hypothetical protein